MDHWTSLRLDSGGGGRYPDVMTLSPSVAQSLYIKIIAVNIIAGMSPSHHPLLIPQPAPLPQPSAGVSTLC